MVAPKSSSRAAGEDASGIEGHDAPFSIAARFLRSVRARPARPSELERARLGVGRVELQSIVAARTGASDVAQRHALGREEREGRRLFGGLRIAQERTLE